MTAATATWRGRRGTVLLGPTQHRVARYLDDRTAHGRVRIRTADLAAALGLERSEAYRITARLRVLGLFGISDDQGGHDGGRYWWRTRVQHDGPGLDPARHREAWRRILGWGRHRAQLLGRGLAQLRATIEGADVVHPRPGPDRPPVPAGSARPPAAHPPGRSAGPTFEERMRQAGMGELIDAWNRGAALRREIP